MKHISTALVRMREKPLYFAQVTLFERPRSEITGRYSTLPRGELDLKMDVEKFGGPSPKFNAARRTAYFRVILPRYRD